MARRDTKPTGLRSVLESRAGMLLDWTEVEKGLLLIGIPAPLLAVSMIRVRFLFADPTDEPYLSRPTLRAIEIAIAGYLVASLVLLLIGRNLRERKEQGAWFVQLCLFLFMFTNAAGAYFVGHFSTPILGASVAAIIASQLLFDQKSVRGMLGLGVFMLFAPIVPIALRIIPYAPLYRASPFIGAEPPLTWLVTTASFSVIIVTAPLALLTEVLRRWRTKDEELHRLARLDGLTEIPNRRYFIERLEVEVERAHRHGSKLALLLLDLDHFKRVNDKHGHQIGDDALVHVARLLSEEFVRKIDVVGRYGGEEFAVLLPETDFDGAMVVAERIRAGIANTPLTLDDGTELVFTTSIGVAALSAPGVDAVDALIRRADGALYRAKELGRNRVESEGERISTEPTPTGSAKRSS